MILNYISICLTLLNFYGCTAGLMLIFKFNFKFKDLVSVFGKTKLKVSLKWSLRITSNLFESLPSRAAPSIV